MPVIQGGRWQRFLQKFFGIKGEVVASELAPEIYAVMPIGDLPLEQMFLDGWIPYSGANSLAASVGNVPIIVLQNNSVGSTVIAKFRRGIFALTAANQEAPLLVSANGGLGFNAVIRGTSRDSRARPVAGGVSPQTSTLGIRQLANAATVGNIDYFRVFPSLFGVTKTYYEIDLSHRQGVVINPGDQLTFQFNVPNVTVEYALWWEERPIESSETTA